KVWHDLGEPASLKEEQRKLLLEAARPYVKTKRTEAEDGKVCVKLSLTRNAVVYFEVNPGEVTSDRGYDYDRVIS
ncbi:MAG: xylan 1,4-beta-xylosidase, partial [Lachnospiraceae bacterium]|nr:xylan 1,4-beta-xylosidase [Lachnospiraceae bacterium]